MKITNFPQLQLADRHVRGFGLIELMIAMVISLLVVLAITSLFLVQKRSYSTQDDLSVLQENARSMVQELSRSFRNAGYKDATTLESFGTDPVIEGVNGTGATGVPASDAITLRFFGSSNLASPPTADGSVIDCQGNPVDNKTKIVETFSIQTGNTDDVTTPWLVCTLGTGNDNDKKWLYSNVESMQILYGEDTDEDGSVNRFRSANAVNMNKVKSVMLSFVMRTPTTNHPAAVNGVFNHFGDEYAADNEGPEGDEGSVFTAAEYD
jgi:type IV pilus assembly protein PilW